MEWRVRSSTGRPMMLQQQVRVWLQVGGSLRRVYSDNGDDVEARRIGGGDSSSVWARHGGVNNGSFGIRPPVQAST